MFGYVGFKTVTLGSTDLELIFETFKREYEDKEDMGSLSMVMEEMEYGKEEAVFVPQQGGPNGPQTLVPIPKPSWRSRLFQLFGS